MSVHEHPPGTPNPDDRVVFLIDGCERCEEYVEMMGRPFDPQRFRDFWDKMVEVEFDNKSGYGSKLDRALGYKLYLVALQIQVAFGIDPHDFPVYTDRIRRLIAAIPD